MLQAIFPLAQNKTWVAAEELTSLVDHVRVAKSPYVRKCPQRPVENFMSILTLFPWANTDAFRPEQSRLLYAVSLPLSLNVSGPALTQPDLPRHCRNPAVSATLVPEALSWPRDPPPPPRTHGHQADGLCARREARHLCEDRHLPDGRPACRSAPQQSPSTSQSLHGAVCWRARGSQSVRAARTYSAYERRRIAHGAALGSRETIRHLAAA